METPISPVLMSASTLTVLPPAKAGEMSWGWVVMEWGPETKTNMSSVFKQPGWLFDIGDYVTTQLYGDYMKPIQGSL